MYNYIEGKIVENENGYLVVDCNGIGYQINVANPFSFEPGGSYKVYVYNQIREDENSLYGFKNKEEKALFLRLIGVKGLGPKMALPMLATGSVNGIIDAIDRENILYLTKFPKIGEKIARQIILDLKGKLAPASDNKPTGGMEELVSVLENFGYKNADIKRVLPHINASATIEEQVKEALKMMLK